MCRISSVGDHLVSSVEDHLHGLALPESGAGDGNRTHTGGASGA
jgi:hypothetical protein